MGTDRVMLRLYGDLSDLAPGVDATGEVDVPCGGPRSVKDAIESCGVPHTEVDLLLVEISRRERRWLLSRDRGLLMRSAVTHGCLVRSTDPDEQAIEIVGRLGIAGRARPLTRCARCNGELAAVTKEAIVDRLEPGTRRDHDSFSRCSDCERVYASSHTNALADFIARALVGTRR